MKKEILRNRRHHKSQKKHIMPTGAKNFFLIFTSLLFVVFLAFLVYSRRGPAGPELVYAPQGELPPGFDEKLILDDNAAIKGSYSVDYEKDNFGQRTATFTSSLTLVQLFEKYKEYFVKNGWLIRKENTSHPKIRGISAAKGGVGATVVILDKGNLREVQVTNVESLQN